MPFLKFRSNFDINELLAVKAPDTLNICIYNGGQI